MRLKTIFASALCSAFLFSSVPYPAQAQKSHATHRITKRKASKGSLLTAGQFPEGTDRLLTDKDVQHKTAWGMKVMLNEIYARHGYVFRDAALRKHFHNEKWYKGKEHSMAKLKLTDIEIQNVAFIKAHPVETAR